MNKYFKPGELMADSQVYYSFTRGERSITRTFLFRNDDRLGEPEVPKSVRYSNDSSQEVWIMAMIGDLRITLPRPIRLYGREPATGPTTVDTDSVSVSAPASGAAKKIPRGAMSKCCIIDFRIALPHLTLTNCRVCTSKRRGCQPGRRLQARQE
jgi:hypothetical protein